MYHLVFYCSVFYLCISFSALFRVHHHALDCLFALFSDVVTPVLLHCLDALHCLIAWFLHFEICLVSQWEKWAINKYMNKQTFKPKKDMEKMGSDQTGPSADLTTSLYVLSWCSHPLSVVLNPTQVVQYDAITRQSWWGYHHLAASTEKLPAILASVSSLQFSCTTQVQWMH